MRKTLALPALLAVCSVPSLLAQTRSAAAESHAPVTLVVKPIDGEAAKLAQKLTPAASSTPFVLNIFTLAGPNVSGGPICYDCVTGAGTPNLGIVEPAGYQVKGAAAPQVDVFLYDFNYTGSCTFMIQMVDSTGTVLSYTNPTFSFTAPTTIALGTALSIPTTAATGIGYVETIATCGSSTSKSASAFLIL